MTLFYTGDKNTKQFSQAAYAVEFYPYNKLNYGERNLIYWRQSRVWSKEKILAHLNSEMTELYFPEQGAFHVRWLYNNIPTEHQWNRWTDKTRFHLSFRVSPALPGETRIVVFDLFNSQEETE